jgi:hypothetical protein
MMAHEIKIALTYCRIGDSVFCVVRAEGLGRDEEVRLS